MDAIELAVDSLEPGAGRFGQVVEAIVRPAAGFHSRPRIDRRTVLSHAWT